jgi:fibronectin-binding autotransporter adhesin
LTGGAPQISVSGGGPHNLNVNPTFSVPGGILVDGTSILNIDYPLVGSVSITKTGTGTLRLDSDANQYTGDLNISAGTVKLNKSNVIPSKANYNNEGNVTVDGTLDLNTYSETINGLNGSGIVDTIAGGTSLLTLGDNNANGTFSGIIRDSSGTLRVTKTGNGTQTLSGANDYAGITEVTAGILVASHNTALGTAANSYATGVRVYAGAELHLSGGITVGDELFQDGGKLRSLSGNNTWGGGFDANARIQIQADSGSTLTLSRNPTHDGAGPWGFYFTGAGDIQVNGQLKMQSQGLTKGQTAADTGTLTFIGDNTGDFGGNNGIKVNCGTLRVTSPGIMKNLTLHVGGNHDASGGGYGTSFGTPTLAGNGTLTGNVIIYGANVAGTIAGVNGATLELQGGLELQSGSKSTFDLAGAPSGDGIRVTGGSFTVSATHTITIANADQAGTYTLFSTDGSPPNPGIANMALADSGHAPGFTNSALFVSGNNIQVTLTALTPQRGFQLIVQ